MISCEILISNIFYYLGSPCLIPKNYNLSVKQGKYFYIQVLFSLSCGKDKNGVFYDRGDDYKYRFRENADMCRALDEIKKDAEKNGVKKGVRQGVKQVIKALVKTCEEFGLSKEMTVQKVRKEFSLSKSKATEYVNQYWG